MNVSLKEYANDKSISYEAVRKQVARYSKELDGHILKNGRTKYLDEYAINFLDNKRKSNPVVIIQSEKDDELQQLRDENKNLLIKIASLQDALLNEKELVKTLQTEKLELLEKKKETETEQRKKHWWNWFN